MPKQKKNPSKKYEDLHFIDSSKKVWNYSIFTDEDIKNFQAGTHYSMYKLLGNKQIQVLNTWGSYFAVWAPNATVVNVVGHRSEEHTSELQSH